MSKARVSNTLTGSEQLCLMLLIQQLVFQSYARMELAMMNGRRYEIYGYVLPLQDPIMYAYYDYLGYVNYN